MPTSSHFREKLRAFYELLAAYHARVLEASSGYNQIVVLGGYAGFFTVGPLLLPICRDG